MIMSTEQKFAVKWITAILGCIGSIILGVAINSWVRGQEEQTRKLDQIYISIIKKDIIDSLQTQETAKLRAEMITEIKETNQAVMALQQSMNEAQKQLIQINRTEHN